MSKCHFSGTVPYSIQI